ncbi:Protein-histidine N-methyltransferase [Aphelenchoides fujianensis]|nr:Protein-histidine N-methyltransferase [Aphelenchoides fujianensis]
MRLKLEESRIGELSALWTAALSEPPPQNQNDLWKEHLEIRRVLGVVDGRPFNFREHLGRPDRAECVAKLVEWLKAEGVDCSKVDVRPVEFGYGLFAQSELKAESVPLEIPHRLMLSLDYGAECDDIRKMHASDHVLSSMSNVTLAMIVAYVTLEDDSRFTAYALKPSPVFEASLLMFRAVSRHFVYFLLRIVRDSALKQKFNPKVFDFRQSPFNSDKFTFDFYRWCVSTVATRMNNLPSQQYKTPNGTPMLIPALIPLVDFANYEAADRGSAAMLFDAEAQAVQLQLSKTLQTGEEISLDYGRRSNGDFLLHNGFVPLGQNEGNSYELKIGFPKTAESLAKQQHLKAKNIQPERGVYSFSLDREFVHRLDVGETALWQFALVFVAADLEAIGNAENKQKAKQFLLQRLQLLQRAYAALPESEDPNGDPISRFVWRLKKSEVDVLKAVEQKIAAYST